MLTSSENIFCTNYVVGVRTFIDIHKNIWYSIIRVWELWLSTCLLGQPEINEALLFFGHYCTCKDVKIWPSRLWMKMSSFLFVCAWAMQCILYLSCGIPFPVWTPDNISGLTSVVVWLSRWEVIKKISGNFLRGGGQNNFGGRLIFEVVFID